MPVTVEALTHTHTHTQLCQLNKIETNKVRLNNMYEESEFINSR